MDSIYQTILKELQQIGYKLTNQRKAIIKTILKNKDAHLSVEELFKLVQKEYHDLGLTTVYRTVDLLEELGF